MSAFGEGVRSAADIDENLDIVLADAGYFSETTETDATDTGVDVLIAAGRMKDGERVPTAPRGPSQETSRSKEKVARRPRPSSSRSSDR
jgi:hypothetical protein